MDFILKLDIPIAGRSSYNGVSPSSTSQSCRNASSLESTFNSSPEFSLGYETPETIESPVLKLEELNMEDAIDLSNIFR